MQKFLIKRIIILYVILLICDFVFFDKKWIIALGLTFGTIFGIFKFINMSKFMSGILVQEEKKLCLRRILVKFLSVQLATVFLLAVSIILSKVCFFGIVAGILIIPVIILINGITEGFGITHNNFQ